jgi:hypothetical protein
LENLLEKRLKNGIEKSSLNKVDTQTIEPIESTIEDISDDDYGAFGDVGNLSQKRNLNTLEIRWFAKLDLNVKVLDYPNTKRVSVEKESSMFMYDCVLA